MVVSWCRLNPWDERFFAIMYAQSFQPSLGGIWLRDGQGNVPNDLSKSLCERNKGGNRLHSAQRQRGP